MPQLSIETRGVYRTTPAMLLPRSITLIGMGPLKTHMKISADNGLCQAQQNDQGLIVGKKRVTMLSPQGESIANCFDARILPKRTVG